MNISIPCKLEGVALFLVFIRCHLSLRLPGLDQIIQAQVRRPPVDVVDIKVYFVGHHKSAPLLINQQCLTSVPGTEGVQPRRWYVGRARLLWQVRILLKPR